jgi:hypothetical protein
LYKAFPSKFNASGTSQKHFSEEFMDLTDDSVMRRVKRSTTACQENDLYLQPGGDEQRRG